MSKQRLTRKLPDRDSIVSARDNIEELMKETRENEIYAKLHQHFDSVTKERVAQAQDSQRIIQNKRHVVTPEVLAQFPNSPSAQRHMVAYQYYLHGMMTLAYYQKDKVETDADCEILQPGFHGYARGHMLEGHMMRQFPFPEIIVELSEQYLKLRPNDVLVEYFKVVCKSLGNPIAGVSDYESSKDKIRSMEKLVHKILPYESAETERSVLINLYYILGSFYVITDQDVRALDSFENCYNLDTSNIDALYAVAYQYRIKSPEKSIHLLNKYLEMAPKCDDKYPNAYYLLGFVNLYIKDLNAADKYYKLGLEAEEKWRLPWQGPVDFPPKQSLEMAVGILKSLPGHKKALA